MTGIRQVKTTFTAGQVSRSLLGRGDLQAYQNGALTLHNVFIQPAGGVTRRAGLRYIDMAAGDGRLVAFEFSTEQVYLLVLTDSQIAVYGDDTPVTTLAAFKLEVFKSYASITDLRHLEARLVSHLPASKRRISCARKILRLYIPAEMPCSG